MAEQKNNQNTDNRGKMRTMWLLFGAFWIGLFVFLWGVSHGLLGEMPSFQELENPKSSLATEVYASDNSLLGRFFIKDRSNSKYEELPKSLVDALVSTEDVRFYSHSGIDFRSLGRVFYKTVLLGQDSGGGSTITQQLAKNLFHDKPNSFLGRVKQKFKEWVIALQLERAYTKEEILTMYLNTVSFGNNAYGVKTASETYFSVPPDSLKTEESALLVGMLKGSTMYNPRRNPTLARERRNVVLSQMYKNGKISNEALQILQQKPLALRYNPMDHNEGIAPYFREYVRSEVKRWAKENTKLDGSNYDIHQDGLKIYTTINATMQKYAEDAVTDYMKQLQKEFDQHWKGREPWESLPTVEKVPVHKVKKGDVWAGTNELVYRAVVNSDRYKSLKAQNMEESKIKDVFQKQKVPMTVFSWRGDRDTTMTPLDSIRYIKRFLHTGFMAVDPSTGHILAWVGGINYKNFKYDNLRPSAKRQVGSTFKPFVYAVAVQNGWSPCMKVLNAPVTFEDYNNWTPDNADDDFDGQWMTLKKGLAHSVNRVTAFLMKQITPEPVVQLAKSMGITSHIDPYPSICLGTADISVYEMVGAYATFANKGIYTKPLFITRIEDKNGNVLATFPPETKEVMSERDAYAMISLLDEVTNSGTANSLRWKYKISAEVAGKTGTTNENSDGWYIGITPKIVAGGWTGGDEKVIHFRSLQLGSGSHMVLPIYAQFMNKVYADPTLNISQEDRFEMPANFGIELNCDLYRDPTTSSPSGSGGSSSPPPMSPTGGGNVNSNDYDYNDRFD